MLLQILSQVGGVGEDGLESGDTGLQQLLTGACHVVVGAQIRRPVAEQDGGDRLQGVVLGQAAMFWGLGRWGSALPRT